MRGPTLDEPFTPRQAAAAGTTRESLRRMVRTGAVRQVLDGVYVSTHRPDSLDLRVAAVRLVLPRAAVIVDETAAWLHDVDVLEPGSHLQAPKVHVFLNAPGHRAKTGLCVSGERRLTRTDVHLVDGLAVTTPLRTACDLGRLRHRDRAMASIDGLLRLHRFEALDLAREVDRFQGYRGVVQLRSLIPLADAGAESPGESALRMRWYDAGLPPPITQYVVPGPAGSTYRLDLALPGLRFAAEYDGAAFHSSPEARAKDEARRRWITEVLGWTLVVLTAGEVYGRRASADVVLRRAFADLAAA